MLLYCLENLKIRDMPLQPEALEEIKNYFKKLPVLRFLPKSFMGKMKNIHEWMAFLF